jgi:hypothetical protein
MISGAFNKTCVAYFTSSAKQLFSTSKQTRHFFTANGLKQSIFPYNLCMHVVVHVMILYITSKREGTCLKYQVA